MCSGPAGGQFCIHSPPRICGFILCGFQLPAANCSLETDDALLDLSSEGQCQPNAMSQCLHRSPLSSHQVGISPFHIIKQKERSVEKRDLVRGINEKWRQDI